jgi:pSer/pThr/pTyr-binding forkhead associated (FHA) protein
MFFGAMQAPGKAKLILIKGEGMDGLSYHLNATEHLAGRNEGPIQFPDDSYLSPRHATFFYRDGRLYVRDEGSRNGVFLRIRNPQPVDSGTCFLAGEQLLRIDACPPDLGPAMDADGTCFYASPRTGSKFRLVQILRGGEAGMIFRARSEVVSIGRDGNDVNFPDDPFISGHHCQVSVSDGRLVLTDLGSKNGTFIRIVDESPLAHGDYVFIGQQLLRTEVT